MAGVRFMLGALVGFGLFLKFGFSAILIAAFLIVRPFGFGQDARPGR